ncbi:unnamed protein product [Clonostachys rhizophaga]|uniref:Xylanolytic transcriptional activator regulatory domain-containing protein n=1 Tax=Clonostachys rhizophaga TaxID=160324 RepID=A0A9N9YQR4_9HYPO|nr:unnamed protein product [Clonostachys rhizophaga]
MSRHFLRTAMTCLSQDDFLLRHRFSTFEALLMVIYNLSHNESLDQGWALLGMALNIGIALRCNVDQNSNPIDTERRRRCWAGLLTLHTYQGILFRDVDMSFLLNIKASLPTDVDDANITEDGISQTRNHQGSTQMTMMRYKIRLFQLSVEICRHISGPARLNQDSLRSFDRAIAEEQQQWDLMYTIDGFPNILNSTSYAHWSVLQTYAHHLYLLIHQPFSHSKSLHFLPESQKRCINSSISLLFIHKQIFEAPLLRNYLWLLSGVTSLKALHAAVALNSCIQDLASVSNSGHDLEAYKLEIEGLATRMKSLSDRSDICFRGCRMIAHLQAQAREKDISDGGLAGLSEETLEGWFDIRDWMDVDPSVWGITWKML